MIGPATGWSRTASSRWVQRRDRRFADDRGRGDRRARGAGGGRVVARHGAGADARGAASTLVERFAGARRRRGGGRRRSRPPGRRAPASSRGVELEPVALGEVDHVERDHGRQAERRSAAARSADDCRGWRRRATISSASGRRSPSCWPSRTSRVTASSGLAGRGCRRRAGRPVRPARPSASTAGPIPLDRHAGIIADLLARAGQRVEQGALAGIGAADHRDQRERVHRGFDLRPGPRGAWRAADGDRHPADADRERIAAERAAVQRLDLDALVKAEMAQAVGLGSRQARPSRWRRPARACRARDGRA